MGDRGCNPREEGDVPSSSGVLGRKGKMTRLRLLLQVTILFEIMGEERGTFGAPMIGSLPVMLLLGKDSSRPVVVTEVTCPLQTTLLLLLALLQ